MEELTDRQLKKWGHNVVTFYMIPIYGGLIALSTVLIGIHLDKPLFPVFKCTGIGLVFFLVYLVFTRYRRTKIKFDEENISNPDTPGRFSLVVLINFIIVVTSTVLYSILGLLGFSCIVCGVLFQLDSSVIIGTILVLLPWALSANRLFIIQNVGPGVGVFDESDLSKGMKYLFRTAAAHVAQRSKRYQRS